MGVCTGEMGGLIPPAPGFKIFGFKGTFCHCWFLLVGYVLMVLERFASTLGTFSVDTHVIFELSYFEMSIDRVECKDNFNLYLKAKVKKNNFRPMCTI